MPTSLKQIWFCSPAAACFQWRTDACAHCSAMSSVVFSESRCLFHFKLTFDVNSRMGLNELGTSSKNIGISF